MARRQWVSPVHREFLKVIETGRNLGIDPVSGLTHVDGRTVQAFLRKGWVELFGNDSSRIRLTPLGEEALARALKDEPVEDLLPLPSDS
jgi:hypothetical protein